MFNKWNIFLALLLIINVYTLASRVEAERLIVTDEWLKTVNSSTQPFLSELRERIISVGLADSKLKLNAAADFNYRLTRMTLAGLLTNDLNLINKSKEQLLKLCQFEYWYRGDHGAMCDLVCSTIASEAALSYNWLKGYLTDYEQATVLSAIKSKAIALYLTDVKRKRWNVMNTHNWGGVVNGNMLLCSLALEKEIPEAQTVKEMSSQLLSNYWGHFSRYGGWDEGVAYLWYGLEVPAFVAFLGATNPNPNCRKTAHWVRNFTSPLGTVANFSDCNEQVQVGSAAGFLAWRFKDSEALALWQSALAAKRYITVEDLIYAAAMPTEIKPTVPPLPQRFIDTDINWGVIRSANGTSWCAVKGGNLRANHSHIDLGSFILVRNGKVVFCDPGCPRPYPPDYFNPLKRYSSPYVRLESHNSVWIQQEPQTIKDKLELKPFEKSGITFTFNRQSGNWRRTFEFADQTLVVKDELNPQSEWNVKFCFSLHDEFLKENPKLSEVIKPQVVTGSWQEISREWINTIPEAVQTLQIKARITGSTIIRWEL